jgi:hypothetical protein
MNPAVIEAFAGLAAAVLGLGGLGFVSLMCFPSFRGAIVERTRRTWPRNWRPCEARCTRYGRSLRRARGRSGL